MKQFLSALLNAARCFTIVDYSVFKICLICIGILLGVYFTDFFGEYIPVIWAIGVVALIYLLARIYRYCKR